MRDYKTENRLAFIRHVYRDFLDEKRFQLLKADLDKLLWSDAYKYGVGGSQRDELVTSIRRLADDLEREGKDVHAASLLG